MNRVVPLVMLLAGGAGTLVAALLLPWAWYGDIALTLGRFPMWGLYAAAAVALHICVSWYGAERLRFVAGPLRGLRMVGLALVEATVVSAVVVMLSYDDPTAFFSGVVPAVAPMLGPGGIVAILSALVAGGAFAGAPVASQILRKYRKLAP